MRARLDRAARAAVFNVDEGDAARVRVAAVADAVCEEGATFVVGASCPLDAIAKVTLEVAAARQISLF